MSFDEDNSDEMQGGPLGVKENDLLNEIRRLKYTHAHIHPGACTHACEHICTHRHKQVHAHTYIIHAHPVCKVKKSLCARLKN